MWKSVTEGEKANCASLGHVWSWLCLFPPFISCLFVLIFGLFAPSALYLVQSLVAYKGGGETGGEICRTNVYAFGFFFFVPVLKSCRTQLKLWLILWSLLSYLGAMASFISSSLWGSGDTSLRPWFELWKSVSSWSFGQASYGSWIGIKNELKIKAHLFT